MDNGQNSVDNLSFAKASGISAGWKRLRILLNHLFEMRSILFLNLHRESKKLSGERPIFYLILKKAKLKKPNISQSFKFRNFNSFLL